MGTGGMKVNHGGLDTASTDIVTAANNIDNRLNQLEGELNKLQPSWTGTASEAYLVARRKWEQAMEEMKTLLNDIGRTVSTSNDEYLASDKRGEGRFA